MENLGLIAEKFSELAALLPYSERAKPQVVVEGEGIRIEFAPTAPGRFALENLLDRLEESSLAKREVNRWSRQILLTSKIKSMGAFKVWFELEETKITYTSVYSDEKILAGLEAAISKQKEHNAARERADTEYSLKELQAKQAEQKEYDRVLTRWQVELLWRQRRDENWDGKIGNYEPGR